MKRFGLSVTLIATLFPANASAQDIDVGPDAATVAATLGVGETEAARRISLQTKLSGLESTLREDPRFAGMKIIQTKDSFRVRIHYKGKKPEVADLTSDPELQALLDVGTSKKSRGEFIALQNRISAAAQARKIRTMIFPDGVAEKVEVHVEDVDAFRQALSDLNVPMENVVLVQSDQFPSPQIAAATVEGGLRITASLGGYCTIGFPATRGADKGLLTAGHCAIKNKNGSASPGVTVSLGGEVFTHVTSTYQASSDLAFFKNGDSVITARVTNRDMKRMSPGLAANLSVICKYGAISGYGCYPVYNNWATTTDELGNVTGPMSVLKCGACTETNQISQRGDSGGPIFLDYDGYGVHHGGSAQYLWYTPVYRASDMSIVPKTAP